METRRDKLLLLYVHILMIRPEVGVGIIFNIKTMCHAQYDITLCGSYFQSSISIEFFVSINGNVLFYDERKDYSKFYHIKLAHLNHKIYP